MQIVWKQGSLKIHVGWCNLSRFWGHYSTSSTSYFLTYSCCRFFIFHLSKELYHILPWKCVYIIKDHSPDSLTNLMFSHQLSSNAFIRGVHSLLKTLGSQDTPTNSSFSWLLVFTFLLPFPCISTLEYLNIWFSILYSCSYIFFFSI